MLYIHIYIYVIYIYITYIHVYSAEIYVHIEPYDISDTPMPFGSRFVYVTRNNCCLVVSSATPQCGAPSPSIPRDHDSAAEDHDAWRRARLKQHPLLIYYPKVILRPPHRGRSTLGW